MEEYLIYSSQVTATQGFCDMNISTLMDMARQRARIRSDAHLAMRCGISKGTATNWRQGRHVPSGDHVLTLCNLAEIPDDVGIAWRNAWIAEGQTRIISTRIANQVTDLHGITLPSEAA